MPWISRERVALHHNGERATDIINTVLNDVKCSKASNNLCIIHDPCVTILLLFQGTFPPVFFCFLVFFLCRESCCCRRDEAEKHLSLEAAEKQMNVKDRSPEPVVFSCLRLFIFFVIPHIFFLFYFFYYWKLQQRENNKYVLRILLVFHFVFEVQAATCASGYKYPDRCWISKDFEQMAC